MANQQGQSELAALKAELASVKSKLAALQCQPDTNNLELPFRILDLPRELRNAIYELCVLPGKVYVHKAIFHKEHDMRITKTAAVQTQIFRLCRQIHNEAIEIYLCKNTFVVLPGPGDGLCPGVDNDLLYIRRLSITLDYRDASFTAVDRFIQNERPMRPHTPDAGFGSTRSLFIYTHSQGIVQLMKKEWLGRFHWLPWLYLDYLQINLQNCYCQQGCHRLVVPFMNAYGFDRLRSDPPMILDILGTVNKEERDFIRDNLSGSTSLRFHGELRPGVDEARPSAPRGWDADKEMTDLDEVREDAVDNNADEGGSGGVTDGPGHQDALVESADGPGPYNDGPGPHDDGSESDGSGSASETEDDGESSASSEEDERGRYSIDDLKSALSTRGYGTRLE